MLLAATLCVPGVARCSLRSNPRHADAGGDRIESFVAADDSGAGVVPFRGVERVHLDHGAELNGRRPCSKRRARLMTSSSMPASGAQCQ
ncbi:MAG TPA: hypothetical protein VG963_03235 [Polyangiaceae bacterium]|nr:hypothetical protein [Polyangiaceae bacterium]